MEGARVYETRVCWIPCCFIFFAFVGFIHLFFSVLLCIEDICVRFGSIWIKNMGGKLALGGIERRNLSYGNGTSLHEPWARLSLQHDIFLCV